MQKNSATQKTSSADDQHVDSTSFRDRIGEALTAFAASQIAKKSKPAQRQQGRFDRDLLPSPPSYYGDRQAMRLHGRGVWRDALCPFHTDTTPSLRINLETGAFRCMACGVHGGDVLAFEMQRSGCDFPTAAKRLNAWRA
ncbi:CHC2 zinc finger domain-containing protein [Chitinilyticum litopenaei]|uniref:CHC2 zinc finger domain-containing protein n=1 Tax=Chitinilyticum litopenaei TaxID=1121276 RepID=UPI00041E912E|nr:CHC2 zinc finger domain-containing protein [Chitinilyticum litopenaei]